MDSYYSKLWNRISLQTCTSNQKPSFSFQFPSDQSPTLKHKRNRDLYPIRRVSSSSRYLNPEGISNLHFSESRILISFDGSPNIQGNIPLKDESPQKNKVVWKEKFNTAILRLKRKIKNQQRELHSVNIEYEPLHFVDKVEKKPKGNSKSLSKKTVDIDDLGADETIMHLCDLGKTPPIKKNKKAISHVDFIAFKGKSEVQAENKAKRGSIQIQIQEQSPNNKREKANPQRMRTTGKAKLKKAMTQDTISVPSSNMRSTNDDLGTKRKNSRQKSSCLAQTNDKTSEDCFSSLSRNRSRTQSLFPNDNPLIKEKKPSPVIKPITQGLDLKALNLRKFKAYTTEKGPKVVSMMATHKENQSALMESKKPMLSYTASGSPCRGYVEEEEPQMENFNVLEDSEADEVVMFETSGWAAEMKEEEKEKIFDGEDYLRAIVSKLKKENKDVGEKKKVGDVNEAVRQTINTRNVSNYLKCRRKDFTPGK